MEGRDFHVNLRNDDALKSPGRLTRIKIPSSAKVKLLAARDGWKQLFYFGFAGRKCPFKELAFNQSVCLEEIGEGAVVEVYSNPEW